MLMACVSVTPGPTDTSAPKEAEGDTEVVSIHISEASTTRVRAEVEVGNQADMEVRLEPAIYSRGEDYVSFQPWDSHDVEEMRICASLDTPCELGETWVPFVPERTFEIAVDWLGPRDFWVVVQFRDSHGDVVPAVGSSEEPESVSRDSYAIIGVVDEETPVESLPLPVQTAVAATRTAWPVRGSVEIEGGNCCVGGAAGDTIQVDVAFEAESPFAEIEAMRVLAAGRCFSESEMDQAQWEPFELHRTYPVKVVINWVGFYVSVQYRDAQGNLSPVYCDDISVEGHPPPPTP